jgi:hypothetical protein
VPLKKGEALKAIGRVLGKRSSYIFGHLAVSGGIKPARSATIALGTVTGRA